MKLQEIAKMNQFEVHRSELGIFATPCTTGKISLLAIEAGRVQGEALELDQRQYKRITLFGLLLMNLEDWSSLIGGYEIQK